MEANDMRLGARLAMMNDGGAVPGIGGSEIGRVSN
jgi:hypothetical protein